MQEGESEPGYQPPKASATYGDLSAVASGKAQVGPIVGGKLSAGAGAGVKRDSDGNTTFYTKVTGNADGDFADGTLQVAGEVESIIGVTVDPNGKIIQVEVADTASGDAVGNLASLTGTQLDGATLGVGDGTSLTHTATLRVTDANRAATVEALKGLGVVTTLGGPAMDEAAARRWILGQARANGDVLLQASDVTKSVIGWDQTNLAWGVLGGWGWEGAVSNKTSIGVWDWDPALGLVDRQGCR